MSVQNFKANPEVAAQELLEALERLVEDTKSVRGIGEDMEEVYCRDAFEQARSAISKAYEEE